MSDTYELIIVSQNDPVPSDVRLKRLLKMMLRTYRFRCHSVMPAKKFGPRNSHVAHRGSVKKPMRKSVGQFET